MSHSLAGFPVWQFSATIGFGGDAHTPPDPAAVVNDQLTFDASALPAESLMLVVAGAPTSVAVYVELAANAAVGVRRAVSDGPSYVTVAATAPPPGPAN